jgi:hypothetical protein
MINFAYPPYTLVMAGTKRQRVRAKRGPTINSGALLTMRSSYCPFGRTIAQPIRSKG